ncbi:glycoside hydrolase superfamily [Massariosphaeria phaeospora]|uniref:glucan endo-1,3-beta-D-glucosidase n=1 Tax=Massariosphaeria phaeospora TaxID=100035 RepID=A0A7C8IB56_9PLEO|nr:glycoside hydrolase superfamily [Massariosphaeria phaeospora]
MVVAIFPTPGIVLVLSAGGRRKRAFELQSGFSFNYGAFWSEPANPKSKADFVRQFKLAQSLDTPVPFNSARLFTSVQQGTTNEPIAAFDAAVETNTSVLLGFWISPTTQNDALLQNELTALDKAFKKHGQSLGDLVIGLSVGSEDVYRFEEKKEPGGVAADTVVENLALVRKTIAESSYAQFMKDKPIGHVDTTKHAAVKGAHFIGMNAYPYWNKDPIDEARKSFSGSLDSLKSRVGSTEIWLTELGWPFSGPTLGTAAANPESMQRYWKEVGCSFFGKVNTFWFQLEKDTNSGEEQDWGLLDSASQKPRIKDLSCPADSLSPPNASSGAPPESTFKTVVVSSALNTPPALSVDKASNAPPASSPPPPASSPAPPPPLQSPTLSASSASSAPPPPPPPPSSPPASNVPEITAALPLPTTTTPPTLETPLAKPAGKAVTIIQCVIISRVNGAYVPIATTTPLSNGKCPLLPPLPPLQSPRSTSRPPLAHPTIPAPTTTSRPCISPFCISHPAKPTTPPTFTTTSRPCISPFCISHSRSAKPRPTMTLCISPLCVPAAPSIPSIAPAPSKKPTTLCISPLCVPVRTRG